MAHEERSEIRDSQVAGLLDKVKKHDFGKYLLKVSLVKIRGFSGEDIVFNFPVTALIGPNGGGKSSVLGAAACAYKKIKPSVFFPKSTIGDESMSRWRAEYEALDKGINPKQTIHRNSHFRQAKWVRTDVLVRPVLYFGIERTVPAGEKPRYKKLRRSTYQHNGNMDRLDENVAKQVAKILGKEVSDFRVTAIGTTDNFFVGNHNGNEYSEFHFGAGESSIIRMVKAIEAAPENALILIEEIENGLHPVATRRMVEYLIDVAIRKSIQAIFTTHSNEALKYLPNEAIWSCTNGKLKQGKLDIETLRAVSGMIDSDLAIFVEDKFAKCWVDTMLRSYLRDSYRRITVYSVNGDGNAVSTHKHHIANPSIKTLSICIIDGDSNQKDEEEKLILRLPGEQPERTIFNTILEKIDEYAALLTVSLHRSPESQEEVVTAVKKIIVTNRDPHLLFNQLGMEIGFVSETIVRSAFLTFWMKENEDYCTSLAAQVNEQLPV